MEGSGRLGRYIMPAGKQRRFSEERAASTFFFLRLPQRQVVQQHAFISVYIPTRAHVKNMSVADV